MHKRVRLTLLDSADSAGVSYDEWEMLDVRKDGGFELLAGEAWRETTRKVRRLDVAVGQLQGVFELYEALLVDFES